MRTVKFEARIECDVPESVTDDEARRKLQDALNIMERQNMDITIVTVVPEEEF